METLFILTALILGFVLGWALASYVAAQKAKATQPVNLEELRQQLAQAQQQTQDLQSKLSATQVAESAERASSAQKDQQLEFLKQELQSVKAQDEKRMQELRAQQKEAEEHVLDLQNDYQHELAKVREENQKALNDLELKHKQEQAQANEARLKEIRENQEAQNQNNANVLKLLAPVQDSLSKLRERLDGIEKGRTEETTQLQTQLQQLQMDQQGLQQAASNIARVMGNNQTRGQWGETTLKNLVEQAGMLEHVDFDTQVVVENNGGEGKSRPDMIIKLPGDQVIPVDAKTPFQAYRRALEIDPNSAEGKDEYAKLMDESVRAIKKHIDDLAKRDYDTDFRAAPGMTILFIPVEAILASAVQRDPQLFDYAYERKVALCTPVTLWAVLKAIGQTWRQQTLSEDAEKLYAICKSLFNGFHTLGSHVSSLGRSLTTAVGNYNKVVGNLERTILPQARKLDAIDASQIEPLNQLEGDKNVVRPLTREELISDPVVETKVIADSPATSETNYQATDYNAQATDPGMQATDDSDWIF